MIDLGDLHRTVNSLNRGCLYPENMMVPNVNWSNSTRHLFWLYGIENTDDDAVLRQLMDERDHSWLFGPYAAIIYKLKIRKRLDEHSNRVTLNV